jgi:YesN/AraC family two-component response regulator
MSESIYVKLQDIGKRYTLLYVEDDEAIANVMSTILVLFCKQFYHAKNGEEGLKLYQEHKPDLIISDISMPVMDGIEMIRAIRQRDRQTPIMINSAFSDQSYLLESIYLGVDRYTVKPIRQDEFLDALYFMFTKLENERQAALYAKIKHQEEVNKASTQMLKTMLHVFPHAMLVSTLDGRVQYLNAFAMHLFDLEETPIHGYSEAISARIMPRDGMVTCLEEIEEDTINPSRMMVRTLVAHKILMAFKRSIQSEEFGELLVYMLVDITRTEYEKQKSQNLSRLFREMLHPKSKPQTQSIQEQPRIVSEPLHVSPPKEPQSYEHIRLQAMHYDAKVSALSYTQGLDHAINEELAEMDELEEELKHHLDEFEETYGVSSLYEIALGIERYSRTIGTLIDFEDIAFSLTKLSTLLRTISALDKNARKLHLLLSGIVDDLKRWRYNLFIAKVAEDIHYLDASLLSSCLQIEIEFFGGALEEEELDLF